jgi:hypothetical protein
MMELRKRKQTIGHLFLALLSVCLTLLILEIGVRWLLPPPYPIDEKSFFHCHDNLGWTGKPNYEGMVEGPEFRQQVVFNSSGMYDTEHSRAKPENLFRILMLGDSYVHAIQVAETETAHQRLENNLNTLKDEPVEVISGGVIHWGTGQQLIYYREQGRDYQPDLVLLMFFIGNDFLDNLPGNLLTIQGFNCYAPYFAVCGDDLKPDALTYAPGISGLENNCSTSRTIIINSIGRLYQNSRLYQQIEPFIISNYPRKVFGLRYPNTSSALYLPNDEFELEQAWQVTLKTIAQFKHEVTVDGHQFAVAIISPEMVIRLLQLSPVEQEQFLQDNSAFANAHADQPNQRLMAFLHRENIPAIDLTPPMIARWQADKVPLYFPQDGHWTAEGNQAVADILTEWLITLIHQD